MLNRRSIRILLATLLSGALWILLAAVASAAPACGLVSGTSTCALTSSLAGDPPESEEETDEEGEEDGEGTDGSSSASEAEEVEEEEESEEEEEEEEGSSKSHHTVKLSDLKLTGKASAALHHHSPAESSLGFSFSLSAPARVHVTLFKQTSVHGHHEWQALPGSVTVRGRRGAGHATLSGHSKLSSGRYMLKAAPNSGKSLSIYLATRG